MNFFTFFFYKHKNDCLIIENEGLVRYTQGSKIYNYITLEKLIKPIADPDILLLLVYLCLLKNIIK